VSRFLLSERNLIGTLEIRMTRCCHLVRRVRTEAAVGMAGGLAGTTTVHNNQITGMKRTGMKRTGMKRTRRMKAMRMKMR
jgi:hypothetical protein